MITKIGNLRGVWWKSEGKVTKGTNKPLEWTMQGKSEKDPTPPWHQIRQWVETHWNTEESEKTWSFPSFPWIIFLHIMNPLQVFSSAKAVLRAQLRLGKKKTGFLGGNTIIRNNLYIFYRKRTSRTDRNNTSSKTNTIILLISNTEVKRRLSIICKGCSSLDTVLC